MVDVKIAGERMSNLCGTDFPLSQLQQPLFEIAQKHIVVVAREQLQNLMVVLFQMLQQMQKYGCGTIAGKKMLMCRLCSVHGIKNVAEEIFAKSFQQEILCFKMRVKSGAPHIGPPDDLAHSDLLHVLFLQQLRKGLKNRLPCLSLAPIHRFFHTNPPKCSVWNGKGKTSVAGFFARHIIIWNNLFDNYMVDQEKREVKMGGNMKTEKNMLLAFVLNLLFAAVEFVGGLWSGSVAIVSDAIHDLGDAMSIGIACALERKSRRQPDEYYTYGYARFSVLGGAITTLILIVGSVVVIVHAAERIIHPVPVHYDGVLLLAAFGVVVNFAAAWLTRKGDSLNQRAVNLHMLEDVLGWLVILVGALVMRWTDCLLLDPVLSIGTALFILLHAIKNAAQVLDLFLFRTPRDLRCVDVKRHLQSLDGVIDVHHLHLWSLDGQHHCATLHAVVEGNVISIKERVRQELREHGIIHAVLEVETPEERCGYRECRTMTDHAPAHHHHH